MSGSCTKIISLYKQAIVCVLSFLGPFCLQSIHSYSLLNILKHVTEESWDSVLLKIFFCSYFSLNYVVTLAGVSCWNLLCFGQHLSYSCYSLSIWRLFAVSQIFFATTSCATMEVQNRLAKSDPTV